MYKCLGPCGEMKPEDQFSIRDDGYRHKKCKDCDADHDRDRKNANQTMRANPAVSISYLRKFSRSVWGRYRSYLEQNVNRKIKIYYNSDACMFTTRKISGHCVLVKEFSSAKKYRELYEPVTLSNITWSMTHYLRLEKIKYQSGVKEWKRKA